MLKVDWQSCHSMSEMPELLKLEEWAAFVHDREKRDLFILEIGSFCGKTTALLAQFGQVLAIDLWGNVDNGLGSYESIGQQHFHTFIQNMIRLRLVERVHPVVSTSSFLDSVSRPLNFDFAFIDGCHSYDGIKLDLDRAEPHLSDNALLVCHDYKRPGWGYPPYDRGGQGTDPWGGVGRAVDELLNEGMFQLHEHFLGIVALEFT